jgi:alpha(1,3/1,4) fucosyltransferase
MKNIAIVPDSKLLLKNKIFEEEIDKHGSVSFLRILKKNYGNQINTIDFYSKKDNLSCIIFFTFSLKELLKNSRYILSRKTKSLLVIYEPFAVKNRVTEKLIYILLDNLFDRILTYDTRYLSKNTFFFNFPFSSICCPFKMEMNRNIVMIASNKYSRYYNEGYSIRREIVNSFKNTDNFYLYGLNWDRFSIRNTLGLTENKINVISNFTFSIVIEGIINTDNYISEKIFHCMQTGTIPIYLGADNILDYIDKECFVDLRDFDSFDSLKHYIASMSNKEINTMYNSITKFLRSDKFQIFEHEKLVDKLDLFIHDESNKNSSNLLAKYITLGMLSILKVLKIH